MDNFTKLQDIIFILESNEDTNNALENALKTHEWSIEIFYISLINQIIKDLDDFEINKRKLF